MPASDFEGRGRAAPPRIPFVAVCVLLYLAAFVGGGADGLRLTITVPTFSFGDRVLRVDEAIALAAAIAAVADGALRPPLTIIDRLMSALACAGAIAAVYLEPGLMSPGYAILLALVAGDATAAAFAPLRDDERR